MGRFFLLWPSGLGQRHLYRSTRRVGAWERWILSDYERCSGYVLATDLKGVVEKRTSCRWYAGHRVGTFKVRGGRIRTEGEPFDGSEPDADIDDDGPLYR